MLKTYKKWTELETKFLIENYYDKNKDFLIENLNNRTWSQIKDKARYIKIRKKSRKLSDISILLKENPISYYWVGFLMADGSFTENRVSLGMTGKDMDHLIKYKKFIKSSNKLHKMPHDYYQVRSVDATNVRILKSKFKITNRKTYEPCDLNNIQNKELLFSLIIGIIDGDGSITKNKNCEAYTLSISLHPSWLQNLDYIKNFLYNYFDEKCNSKPAYIRERNINLPQDDKDVIKKYRFSEMYVGYRPLLIKIKKKAMQLNLPFMERKLGTISSL